MTRLRQRDFAAFSRALATLYADTSVHTLSDRILGSLHSLFDCDFASFSLMDLRQARFHATYLAPLVPDWPGAETHQRHVRSDPAAAHIMRTREPFAVKISDFVSLREYRSLGVYTEVFGRVGCDRRLGFAVQDESPVSLIATLNRKGRDFSDEDRRLLDLLRPHLLQANAHAYAGQRLHAERQRERARLSDVFGAGLGEIDAAGRVFWLTARAETLLGEFFPGPARPPTPTRLPGEMTKRMVPALRERLTPTTNDAGKLRPLVWRFAGPDRRVLKVRLVAGSTPDRWQLLLEEARPATSPRSLVLKLTPRQREVLAWLKQGKTNWEIARILGVTEKTTGKHLENIFARLHVENCTAAVHVATEAAANF